ncbi:uncharacterized protein N7511_002132 [Penicillium nucicola]|uniref:uncharacterized protein n=1 Tax=Penicillium nucicola TaxID=1850975 RepID=UPI00254526F0|nr:uncharacterized protein N7511_002132 [Penicillium nucicola]KAJ5770081.1 hypothetical protein N7511_002132 [Penicillium nucicola]
MPDMYAIQPCIKADASSQKDISIPKYTPNIIPCKIHHDGAIDTLDRYWAPATDEKDNTQTSYFRGRKLRGRRVALPDGYRGRTSESFLLVLLVHQGLTGSVALHLGIIATPTERTLPSSQQVPNDDEVVEVEPEEPVKILEMNGTFEGVVVWGHEALPAADDTFVKGVEEWLQFAEAMHGTPAPVNGKEAVA